MVPPGRPAAARVRQPSQGLAALDAGSARSRRRLGITIARKSIVTKTGDGGETGLLYGGRVAKTDPRTEAYGAVDEAISTLGAARALVKDRGRHAIILRIQSELFTVGAELATDAAEYDKLEQHFMVVTTDFTSRVESEIVDLERRVPLPDAFVIPGGTAAAAALDVAPPPARPRRARLRGPPAGGRLRNPEVL